MYQRNKTVRTGDGGFPDKGIAVCAEQNQRDEQRRQQRQQPPAMHQAAGSGCQQPVSAQQGKQRSAELTGMGAAAQALKQADRHADELGRLAGPVQHAGQPEQQGGHVQAQQSKQGPDDIDACCLAAECRAGQAISGQQGHAGQQDGEPAGCRQPLQQGAGEAVAAGQCQIAQFDALLQVAALLAGQPTGFAVFQQGVVLLVQTDAFAQPQALKRRECRRTGVGKCRVTHKIYKTLFRVCLGGIMSVLLS